MTIAAWVEPIDLVDKDSPYAEPACRIATRVLYALTGRIYGGEKSITEVYYPQSVAFDDSLRTLTLQRYGIGIARRSFPYRSGVTGDTRIPLRGRPAREIQSLQVVTTGEFVDPGSYWISDSTYLSLVPSVPTMSGLSVEYIYGTNPPPDGVDAARAFANELITMMGPSGDDCKPRNVTSFSRQGVSFEVEDLRSIMTDGRTGIPEVDLFVESVNPARRGRSGATANRAQMRSRVLSPDSHQAR